MLFVLFYLPSLYGKGLFLQKALLIASVLFWFSVKCSFFVGNEIEEKHKSLIKKRINFLLFFDFLLQSLRYRFIITLTWCDILIYIFSFYKFVKQKKGRVWQGKFSCRSRTTWYQIYKVSFGFFCCGIKLE